MTDKVWTWVELLKQIEAHARECDTEYIEKQRAYEIAKMEHLKANEALDEFVQLMATHLNIPSKSSVPEAYNETCAQRLDMQEAPLPHGRLWHFIWYLM